MKKLIITVVAGLVLAGGATGLIIANKEEPKQTQQSTQSSQVQQKSSTEVSYKGVEGKNALELLKQTHKVETKTYKGIGELVTSIDGVSPDSKHFWAFYVNGQQSQVGAGAYTAKGTDTVIWKLEEVK